MRATLSYIAMTLAAICTGCAVTPAPGASQVKITNNPADVSACSPVGNINREAMSDADPHVPQNLAIGLNANVIFNTGAGGIAYRCGKAD